MRQVWRALLLVAGIFGVSGLAVAEESNEPIRRIAFGSCAKQSQPQPIWDSIVETKPEVFLFIGDNIYGDSRDMSVLKSKWAQLGAQPGYQKLKDTCPVFATWDDHDYGENDAGKEYPPKRESQKVFLKFFEEPADSPRWNREGIYAVRNYGPADKRVQIILLDTRYFRDRLVEERKPQEPGDGYPGYYVPTKDTGTTVLGEAQWKWLEEQLKKPAKLRIIASSIQVVPNDHGWEKWGNFPHERERLLELVKKTKAEGVVFISGDRHHAEISRLVGKADYPLFDVTSSSLNQPSKWHNEINPHRMGSIYTPENFGTILIDWEQPDPTVRLQVRSIKGTPVIQVKTSLSELQP